MTLDELDVLLSSGQFHHATYRNFGTVWEGLYIYTKYDGLRGFDVAGVFNKGNPDLDKAEEKVKHTGISVGAFGSG